MLKFGSFEFDPRRHELRRNGFRIKLAASQLRLLTLFLERSGELITRDQITARLWADTRNIDVSTGINTAINRLRRHLQESPGDPSAIETVIGLGYRFVPEVRVESTAENTAAANAGSDSFVAEEAASRPISELKADSLIEGKSTAEPTENDEPVLIDDASTAASSAAQQAPTSHSQDSSGPGASAASTEVRRSLFRSRSQGGSGERQRVIGQLSLVAILSTGMILLFVAAVLVHLHSRADRSTEIPGNLASGFSLPADRPIGRVTVEEPLGEVTAAAVSPDGTMVAYADRFGVSVHWFDSRQERLLGVLPAFVVNRLSWLPDQSGLLMSGTERQVHSQQVWFVPLQGAYLQPILQDADRAVPSPDGKRVAFTRGQDQEVWEASSDGQGQRRMLEADPDYTFGLLLWSPDGDRLVLTEAKRATGDSSHREPLRDNIYLCIEAASGKILDREGGVPTQSGYMLRDGQLFFAQNNTPGPTTGEANLMEVRTDGRSGRLVDQPRFVQKFTARYAQSLTASLTGTRFAAVLDKAETDTFVSDLRWPGPSLSDPLQLTKGTRQNFPHAWTADGRGVLLENDSVRTRGVDTKWAIFNVALTGSAPKLVAQLPGDAAMEQLSPDGRWILFLQFEGKPQRASGIFRVPVEGGPVERIPTSGNLEEFHCSASRTGRCVLREAINQNQLVYYALDPERGMGDELARTPWEPNRLGDWGLSADGAFVAAAQHDTLYPGIELIDLKSHGSSVRKLPVLGHGTTLGANWSQDGKTLFVECRTGEGFELVTLDLAGHVRLLRASPSLIWAVTSRDGKKIAFPGLYQSSSVWASIVQPRTPTQANLSF